MTTAYILFGLIIFLLFACAWLISYLCYVNWLIKYTKNLISEKDREIQGQVKYFRTVVPTEPARNYNDWQMHLSRPRHESKIYYSNGAVEQFGSSHGS